MNEPTQKDRRLSNQAETIQSMGEQLNEARTRRDVAELRRFRQEQTILQLQSTEGTLLAEIAVLNSELDGSREEAMAYFGELQDALRLLAALVKENRAAENHLADSKELTDRLREQLARLTP